MKKKRKREQTSQSSNYGGGGGDLLVIIVFCLVHTERQKGKKRKRGRKNDLICRDLSYSIKNKVDSV